MSEITNRTILDLQEKFVAKNDEFEQIQKTINYQNNQISEIKGNRSCAQDLRKKMSVFKADKALGIQPDTSAVEELQKNIDLADQDLADIKEIENVIAGLKIKADQVEIEKRELGYSLRDEVESYIRGLMEDLGRSYMNAAQDLVKYFRQIQAIGHLHNKIRGHKNRIISGHENQELSIPVFTLKACNEDSNTSMCWPKWSEVVKINKQFHVLLREDIQEQTKRIGEDMKIRFDLVD